MDNQTCSPTYGPTYKPTYSKYIVKRIIKLIPPPIPQNNPPCPERIVQHTLEWNSERMVQRYLPTYSRISFQNQRFNAALGRMDRPSAPECALRIVKEHLDIFDGPTSSVRPSHIPKTDLTNLLRPSQTYKWSHLTYEPHPSSSVTYPRSLYRSVRYDQKHQSVRIDAQYIRRITTKATIVKKICCNNRFTCRQRRAVTPVYVPSSSPRAMPVSLMKTDQIWIIKQVMNGASIVAKIQWLAYRPYSIGMCCVSIPADTHPIVMM